MRKIIGLVCVFFALIVVTLSGVFAYAEANKGASASKPANLGADEQEYNGSGQTRNLTLYVRQTELKMPDGQKIWAFGYTDDPKGEAKIPGPPIVVEQGDDVNVTLIDDKDPTKTQYNTDGDGHTIHMHGLDLSSDFDGDPMTAKGGTSVLNGKQFTYHFRAKYAGTYWYHCHQGATEHIQMGMYGALVIRPHGQPQRAYANTSKFDKEYTFVLSDMDSGAHAADRKGLYEGGEEPNWSNLHANYFMINGKAWPDTMKDPHTNIEATVGQTILVRLINSSYNVHTMHSHGFHFQVVGTDGRKLDYPYYKDTLSVGPGERYDILLKLNQVGRYMFHDHNEVATTNNGEYPGGMITMINVNNKDGSNPVPMSQMMES